MCGFVTIPRNTPAFPMKSFRAAVMGRAEDQSPRYVTTANLNIRSGPGTQNQTLPGSPSRAFGQTAQPPIN